MLDTLAVTRKLADADFTPAQVDAAIDAVHTAAARGDHVTPDLSPWPSPGSASASMPQKGRIDGRFNALEGCFGAVEAHPLFRIDGRLGRLGGRCVGG